MKHVFATVIAMSFSLSLLPMSARADWEPPKDGLVTEKQVTAFLQVMKELVGNLRAQGKALEGNNNNAAAAMAMLAATDARYKASLTKAGLAEEEYRWVGERVWEARGAILMLDLQKQGKTQIAETVKKNEAEQAAAKQKIAT